MLDSTQHATLARTFLALAERGAELDHANAVLIALDLPLAGLAERIKSAAREDVAESLDTLAAAFADARESHDVDVLDAVRDAESNLDSAAETARAALRLDRVDVERVESARYDAEQAVDALDRALEMLDADADAVEMLETYGDGLALAEFVARLSVAARLDAYNGHAAWSTVRVTLERLDILDHVARLAGITTGVDPVGRYGLDPVR